MLTVGRRGRTGAMHAPGRLLDLRLWLSRGSCELDQRSANWCGEVRPQRYQLRELGEVISPGCTAFCTGGLMDVQFS